MSFYGALKTASTLIEGTDLIKLIQIGHSLISFKPREGEELSLDHTAKAYPDQEPANDDDCDEARPSAPQPPAAGKIDVLAEFATALLKTPQAPRWLKEMANDWLKTSALPGAELRGQNLLKQAGSLRNTILQRMSSNAAAALQPDRRKLKVWQSEQPLQPKPQAGPKGPKSVDVVTRQFLEKQMAERMRPKAPV